MKKSLIALVLCVLIAASLAVLAEETASAPRIGDVVNGFELTEIEEYRLIGGRVYRFLHQRTGAELFYIANADTNRAFQLSFHTQAVDNTGLPHVFEHATLKGSEKYPSQDLFMSLLNGSYTTYMNASTGQNVTFYQAASLSEAQLLKLADLYTDCCLHPLIMQDEGIFRKEAWRYRLNSADDPLTIEGTVYSEMQGSINLKHAAADNFTRLALPGSCCGNLFGGLPEAIPDMTYDDLKAYHDRFYHPSNCFAFLYGRFDDYAAFLKLLDEAFSGYEAREITLDDPGYTPITGPVEALASFPVEAGSDTRDASAITYGFVCPGLRDDPEDVYAFSTLVSMMNNNGSNICQAIQKALPKAAYGFSLYTQGPDIVFTGTFTQVNPEDAETVKSLVNDGLRDIMENGFSQEMVDSVESSLEISDRIIMESSNIGISLMRTMAANYCDLGNPWHSIRWTEALKKIGQWNQDGTYRGLIEKWLVDSDLTALSVTQPEAGAKEQNDAALQEKLAEIKAGMSAEELDALVASSNAAVPENPDIAAMIADLTAVTVESLPEEVRDYPLTDETGADGVRRIDTTANVDGIGIVRLLLDASAVPQEDLHWLMLYTYLLDDMDTARNDQQTLEVLISRYLYGFNVSIAVYDVQACHPYLGVSWIALDRDLEKSYDLTREILFETSFDDTDRLLERVQHYLSALKSSFNNNPYSPMINRGLSKYSDTYRYLVNLSGLGFYDFLKETERQLQEDPGAVTEKLRSIQDYFNNNAGLILGYCGSDSSIALNRPIADAFAASLDHRELTPVNYDLPVIAADSEALIVDSAVQYNGIVLDFEGMGMADGYRPEIRVLNKLIVDMIFTPQLREQYGVYGTIVKTDRDVGVYLTSYRDPNIAETFSVYDALSRSLQALDVDQATIDRFILTVYTDYAMPVGELTGALQAQSNHLFGHDTNDILEDMRALKRITPQTVADFAEAYGKLAADGYRFTGGGAAAIRENAALYDSVLNPFGAGEGGQALSDVSADDEVCAAIQYVREKGYMLDREDGAFAPGDSATTGDLAAGLLAILGQPQPAEAAVETLLSFGLLEDGAAADDPLTPQSCDAALSAFANAMKLTYPGGFAGQSDPCTRADLAVTLTDYAKWIEANTAPET